MKFMTIPQYAEHSGFSKSKIRLMIGHGEIVAKKLDGRWYISLEQTEKKLQEMFERPERDRFLCGSWKSGDDDWKALIRSKYQKVKEELDRENKSRACKRA